MGLQDRLSEQQQAAANAGVHAVLAAQRAAPEAIAEPIRTPS